MEDSGLARETRYSPEEGFVLVEGNLGDDAYELILSGEYNVRDEVNVVVRPRGEGERHQSVRPEAARYDWEFLPRMEGRMGKRLLTVSPPEDDGETFPYCIEQPYSTSSSTVPGADISGGKRYVMGELTREGLEAVTDLV